MVFWVCIAIWSDFRAEREAAERQPTNSSYCCSSSATRERDAENERIEE